MRQIVINISENEYKFFMKLIKNFPFIQVDEKKSKLLELEERLSPYKREIWKDIKEGIKEVELIEKGEMKAKSAKDFLNEL
ncbi:MAG: hypothetical protein KKA81_02060 [Bacteroidetes bacterium]|nr:hypothetical protein [Bacteroidota bacterium]